MRAFILAFCVFFASVLSATAQLKPFAGSGHREKRDRTVADCQRRADHALRSKISNMFPEALTWDNAIGSVVNHPDGGTITCFAAEGDDLYVGGDFFELDTTLVAFVAHYDRKTERWDDVGGGVSNTVEALAVHKGKLYVAGRFSSMGQNWSQTAHRIAEWDGVAWHDLGGGMNGSVFALAFVGDTLFAGGAFTSAGGIPAYCLAAWDGVSWNEPAGATTNIVYSLYATHDSLFVGGAFSFVGNSFEVAHGIAMLQNDSWTVFGNGLGNVQSIVMYQNKLIAAGDFWRDRDGQLLYDMAVWDGSSWAPFGNDTIVGTSGTGNVDNLFVSGDTLLAFGAFSTIAGNTARGIARYQNGTWSEFGGGSFGEPMTAISFDGKLYVGGRFSKIGGAIKPSIAILHGGRWDDLGGGHGAHQGWQSDLVTDIATNGRYIFIVGNFTTVAGKICNHVAAWDKQTNSWIPMGEGVDGDATSVVVAGNTIVVGGHFNHAGNVSARHIASCNISTKVWSAMGAGAVRSIEALASDGTNVYANVFASERGMWPDNIGKWDGTSWSVASGPLDGGYVQSMTYNGSTLYVGGDFLTADGIEVRGIASLQNGQWAAMNSGVDSGSVYAIAVSKGNVFVGGSFTQADGQPSYAIARWDGANWDPIGSGFDDDVFALEPDGSGGVYVGGRFGSAGTITAANNLVRWNASNKRFQTVSGGADNTVTALATDTGALYVGGWFEQVGTSDVPSNHVAALKGAGVTADVAADGIADMRVSEVYPNPSSQDAKIDFRTSVPTRAQTRIRDIVGRTVADETLPLNPGSSSIQLPTQHLLPGVFDVEISVADSVIHRTLVIQ